MNQQSQPTPANPEYFSQASEAFEVFLATLSELSEKRIECNVELQDKRSQRSDRENYIVANGGSDIVTIDGKNVETRKAQTELACGRDVDWADYDDAVRTLERILAELASDETEQSNLLSLAKRRMDYAIAFIGHETALLNVGAMKNVAWPAPTQPATGGNVAPAGIIKAAPPLGNGERIPNPSGLYGNKAH